MALSKEQFEAILTHRSIFYFVYPPLNTPDPHYFVCVGQLPSGEYAFSCCTSQFNTVRKFVEIRRLPNTTLVFMPPAVDNPFDRDTYVNCNEYFGFHKADLWEMYNLGSLTEHGEFPLESYEQIVIGFKDSTIIDEELKDNLPEV
ncbi:MAG: hypothetical protein SGI83_09820 [Bacteroidota bacterium]|nr:hypothetical protein [Bacteroidota bacterium]